MIHRGRSFASVDGPFAVFLIGMRINRPWKVHKWWPVAMAMPRMIRELEARPELGLLGSEFWFRPGQGRHAHAGKRCPAVGKARFDAHSGKS